MKLRTMRQGIAGVVAASALLCAANDAHAADCQSLMNPVYVAGSSAVKPVLQQIAKILEASTASPQVNIVYISVGSCAGLDGATNGTKQTATPVIWDSTGAAGTCTLPTGGVVPDVGVSDVFPATCPNITVPANMQESQGPVQVMNFVVPAASNQSSISAEAAFAVLGWAGTGKYDVSPWTDPKSLFIRADTSGTKQMIASAIGLPASKWVGTVESGSGAVLSAVQSATTPNAAVGILASDLLDANRSTVKGLAFQAKGQMCGYLPDSASTAFDKINVREGRYDIWGPVHFVAASTPSASVAAVLNQFTRTGLSTAAKQTMIDAEAAAHTIPQCAMHVKRTSEVGAEMSFQPDEPCGCYFESKVGTASASCHTCQSDTDCTGSANHCRYGYCEVK